MNSTPKLKQKKCIRVPTPKILERRKSLFTEDGSSPHCRILEDSDLGPIGLLDSSSSDDSQSRDANTSKNTMRRTNFKNILKYLSPSNKCLETVPENILTPKKQSNNSRTEESSFVENENSITTEMSPAVTKASSRMAATILEKENICAEHHQLKTPEEITNNYKKSNTNSPRLLMQQKKSLMFDKGVTPEDDSTETTRNNLQKRNIGLSVDDGIDQNCLEISSSKLSSNNSKAKTSLIFTEYAIPASKFYSSVETSNNFLSRISTDASTTAVNSLSATKRKRNYTTGANSKPPSLISRKQKSVKRGRKSLFGTINKGVSHNITKAKILKKNNKPLKTKTIKEKIISEFRKTIEYQAQNASSASSMNTSSLNSSFNSTFNKSFNTSRNTIDNSITTTTKKQNNQVDNRKQFKPTFIMKPAPNAVPLKINLNAQYTSQTNNSNLINANPSKSNAAWDDSSDTDSDSVTYHNEDDVDNVDESNIDYSKRKFFKSKRPRVIYQSYRPIVYKSPEKKKRKHEEYDEFEAIQEYVADIVSEMHETENSPNVNMSCENNTEMLQTELSTFNEHESEINRLSKLIPYNTNDPKKIETQEMLLDFLIFNGICNERNFKIFISEPELHTEEANRILDELCIVDSLNDSPDIVLINNDEQIKCTNSNNGKNGSTEFNKEINRVTDIGILQTANNDAVDNVVNNQDVLIQNTDTNLNNAELPFDKYTDCSNVGNMNIESSKTATENDDPMSPASQISSMTSELVLNCTTKETPEKSSISGQRLFSVFYRQEQIINKETAIGLPKVSYNNKKWKPIGNQYQIDAGQKEFGSKHCIECGFLYTTHVPEDELIHKNYHDSINTFKFTGWSNERLVSNVSDWGDSGRIICVDNTSTKAHKTRAEELIQIVDRELGILDNKLPERTIIYLGIASNKIIGLCAAQPLTEARKIRTINGIDHTSEETYSVRCGISRIWVSPPFRGYGIAKKLLQAVQSNFIIFYELKLDDIAFSSPTEMGKVLAKTFFGRSDFLVYDRNNF